MLPNLLVTLALAVPALEDKPADTKAPPAAKELFAKEKWYQDQEGKEQEFVGTLKKAIVEGRVGFGRFNPYRLSMSGGAREVYVGGKPSILDEYINKKVKITGKAVDINVEGKNHREIWPARIELVKEQKSDAAPSAGDRVLVDKPADDPTKEPKILARGFWRASARPGGQPQQLAIRSAADAAAAMGLPKDGKGQEQATMNLVQALKAKEIDWDKQMVIVVTAGAKPTGGYRVEVTGLAVNDKTLTVKWKLHSPAPGSIVTQAFTHPAEAILVNKFDGDVKFDPALKGKE